MKSRKARKPVLLVQEPRQALLVAARLMRGDSRQIDIYTVLRVKNYDGAYSLIPQAYQFRWCRRDKRYYSEPVDEKRMLVDTSKWRYWLGDWFQLVVADGVPLEAARVSHELEKMKLERLKNMPIQLKHLMQKRTVCKPDHAVYCSGCHDWLPTVQLRYICPHQLNCIDTPVSGCGMKRYVKEECRKYNTCFIDLDDQERAELIKSINKERYRKHGWSRRMANKPLMKSAPDVWDDPRRRTVRAKDYDR